MSAAADALDAGGWSPPLKILCNRNGPVCKCGSYAYRSRPEPTAARPSLIRFRCEKCGRLALLDLADPDALLTEVDGAAALVEQGALF